MFPNGHFAFLAFKYLYLKCVPDSFSSISNAWNKGPASEKALSSSLPVVSPLFTNNTDNPNRLLTAEEVAKLGGNIDDILHFHQVWSYGRVMMYVRGPVWRVAYHSGRGYSMTGFKSRFGFVILSLGMLVTIYWDKLGLRQRFRNTKARNISAELELG